MTTDILAQARALSEKSLESVCGYPHTPADWIAAVDTLAAEVERLREWQEWAENAPLKDLDWAGFQAGEDNIDLHERAERAEAEVERLRAQLAAVREAARGLTRAEVRQSIIDGRGVEWGEGWDAACTHITLALDREATG